MTYYIVAFREKRNGPILKRYFKDYRSAKKHYSSADDSGCAEKIFAVHCAAPSTIRKYDRYVTSGLADIYV